MSIHHEVTFKCDSCDQNFLIEESMDLPPNWLGLQVICSNTDGIIPEHEQENFCHFCSPECLIEYTTGDELLVRLSMVDQNPDFDEDEDPEDPNNEVKK